WSVLVISRWTIGISKWTIPLQVLLMVGLALLSYYGIEKPLRHAQWSRNNVRTIAYGLGGISASALLLLGLLAPLQGQLYLGQTFPEATSTSFKLAPGYKECRDAMVASPDFAECTYPKNLPDAQRIYFVGDSHSVSLKALASRLVEQGQIPRVAMVGRNKCFFSTSLIRRLENGQRMENCRTSAQMFVAHLLKTGQPGDIVMLTNRYLAYFLTPNYFADADRVKRGDFSLVSGQSILSQEEALQVYARELVDMSRALATQGVELVVQAPLPDWKHLPHECQPEWFRTAMALPETCRLTAEIEAQRRLPIVEAFQQAATESDNLYMFDPFSVFCQEQNCSPFSAAGVPLFKDDDHLNNDGAEALYQNFTDFLRQHRLI
ncbi:MAG: SGNH hydrolase domain-containing protein, partial [Cyanobacteria bacterium J06642_11]